MKKLVLSLLTMAMAIPAFSQTENGVQGQPRHRDRSEMIERRTQEMTQKYGLSAEQADKVKALNEKYMVRPFGGPRDGERRQGPPRDRKPSGDNAGPNDQNRGPRGGMRQNMEEYNKELEKIMTEAQYKEYVSDMEKRMAERRNRRQGN